MTNHNTFTIERRYPASPERVFAAFADPAKKRKWFAEGGAHDVQDFQLDFRVGGSEAAIYRMGANTPFPGMELASHGVFHDIVDNQRIVSSSTMSIGGRHISTALTTFELNAAEGGGTQLIFTHQAAFYEGSDGPEMRKGGWNSLLSKLGNEFTHAHG